MVYPGTMSVTAENDVVTAENDVSHGPLGLGSPQGLGSPHRPEDWVARKDWVTPHPIRGDWVTPHPTRGDWVYSTRRDWVYSTRRDWVTLLSPWYTDVSVEPWVHRRQCWARLHTPVRAGPGYTHRSGLG